MNRMWRLSVIVVSVAALVVLLPAQRGRPRPEISLIGVRVFTPITQVVKQFGNPTMVTNAQIVIRELSNQQDRGQLPGPEEGQPPTVGGTSGAGETRTEEETVLVYRSKGGSTYVFQFNKDGRVVQISAYGRRPDPRVRTSRGIGLNDTFDKVIAAYGQPSEPPAFSGDIYVIRYNKLGVAFQFDSKSNRVTGIFVAAGVPSLGAGFTSLGTGASGGARASGPTAGPVAPGGMGAPGGRGGGGGAASATAL
ncbi:MAG: hypothetical protein NZ550_04530 [Fimbriimonadales bacterium]|nr:hypothetical protein [Fimbriimonadales bacterium]MDW8051340.1 hypothetical protein [Armatimonadota bacterium]